MNHRGCVSFVFDDGYQKVFDDVVPRLETHHFPGVFAIPLNQAHLQEETGQNFTPWQNWIALRSRHEIAAHSKAHTDLTKLAINALERELREPAETLASTTLVYPGGAYNQIVKDRTKKYYQAARTLKHGFNQLNPANPYELHSFNYTRDNYSLMKANARVLWAYLTNAWLIETYHLIDDATPITHSIRMTDFTRHLEFIARLPIAVKTITQVVSS